MDSTSCSTGMAQHATRIYTTPSGSYRSADIHATQRGSRVAPCSHHRFVPLETLKTVYLEETFEFHPPKTYPKSLLALLRNSFNMTFPVLAQGLQLAGIGVAGLAARRMVMMML
ncbi:hypothetical protein OAO87_01985 [bacterium]|nr:hypothetical protein [bacterium]